MATACTEKSNNYKDILLTDLRELVFDMVCGDLEEIKSSHSFISVFKSLNLTVYLQITRSEEGIKVSCYVHQPPSLAQAHDHEDRLGLVARRDCLSQILCTTLIDIAGESSRI